MIKVLIVDDSPLMRQMIKDIVEKDTQMEVVSMAINGEDAITKTLTYEPDVILMDIEMPVMNGLQATRKIMQTKPTPIIVISGYNPESGDITIKSLESGAVDFIPKPSGTVSTDIEDIGDYIRAKIKVAALVDISKLAIPASQYSEKKIVSSEYSLLIIGSSTGGPRALTKVIPYLPEDFPLGVVVIQHMPAGFTASLAQRLDRLSPLKIKEAEMGDIIKPGTVLIAPGGKHLKIDNNMHIVLEEGVPYNGVKPSLDVTLFSIRDELKKPVFLVVLTGMGKDGLEGTFFVKDFGSYVVVESPETAVIDGMPGNIRKKGLADKVVRVEKIASEIIEILGED